MRYWNKTTAFGSWQYFYFWSIWLQNLPLYDRKAQQIRLSSVRPYYDIW